MKKLLTLIFAIIVSASYAQTWKNPFSLSGELVPHGIGDPYMLKYKGVYYLYASNDEDDVLRCWSSKDLIHWSDSINCSTDPLVRGAYAPEVIYWNGIFYMYTSPYGRGHYVLCSDSPTGPFTAVTGNYGKEIDGSVFIDDDGKMYFYHAHNDGIHGSAMPTPTTFGPGVNLGARMTGQWTEGPCVIKRNGIYYLLYTGNHVLSKGYRIDYAINATGAISSYTPQAGQNPILIRTEGSHVGLGHGTAFVGPDLDTYYFTYHNLVTIGGGQPYRKFNFDRIAWNGDKLSILGPTDWVQQDPPLATADYFDRTEIGTNWTMPGGGNWGISNQDFLFQDVLDNSYKAIFTAATASDYTAEFTVREVARNSNDAKLGAVFSYSNEQNYGVALFNSHTNQLEINFLIDNVWETAHYLDLPSDFNYAVWHSIRIEKSETSYNFFVDGMQKVSVTSNLQGGKVGYTTDSCQGNFSYIALSDKVNGSGIFDTYKPIPGNMAAVHYNSGGEGVGYHDLATENTGRKYRYDGVDTGRNPEGGYHISENQTGEWYKYNVNVESSGVYNIGIRYAASGSSSQIRIWQGETDVTGVVDLPATGGMNSWRTFTIKGANLTAGYQTLKAETVTGDFNFYELRFRPADNEPFVKFDDFETGFSSEWNYSDGNWKIDSGRACVEGSGKKTMGSTGWTDYTIEADVTYLNVMNAGIIFRVNNPAIGGANDSPELGTDYLQGYFVGLGNSNVSLGKHNYSWSLLTSKSGSYSLNTSYHIKIVVSGANIKVYVTDMITPKIDYTDPNPFISGKVGLRSCNAHAHFDNFSVTTTNTETKTEDISANATKIFPNPVGDLLTVGTDQKSFAKIYNTTGQLMIAQTVDAGNNQINVNNLPKGTYIIRLHGDKAEISGKWIKE